MEELPKKYWYQNPYKVFLPLLLLLLILSLVTINKYISENKYLASSPTPNVLPLETENPITPSPMATSSSTLYKVTKIIDGDTIALETGEKVRYIGIDTPETNQSDCFAKEAANKNKELVEGKLVRLEKDVSETDRFNRLLRYVYLENGLMVNDILVSEGYAFAATFPPDVKYQNIFRNSQEVAKNELRGLWNSCQLKTASPSPQPSPVSQNQTTPLPTVLFTANKASTNDCLIKGNISTKGEKIYHTPNCSSYEKTKIDELQGEKWFCSEKEAEDAGWRKAKNC